MINFYTIKFKKRHKNQHYNFTLEDIISVEPAYEFVSIETDEFIQLNTMHSTDEDNEVYYGKLLHEYFTIQNRIQKLKELND